METHAKKNRTFELESHSIIRGKPQATQREHHGMLIKDLLNTL